MQCLCPLFSGFCLVLARGIWLGKEDWWGIILLLETLGNLESNRWSCNCFWNATWFSWSQKQGPSLTVLVLIIIFSHRSCLFSFLIFLRWTRLLRYFNHLGWKVIGYTVTAKTFSSRFIADILTYMYIYIYKIYIVILFLVLPRWLSSKVSICSAGDAENLGLIPGSDPWVGTIPWSQKWQPALVFLPGKAHGQRSLVGPCCYKRVRYDLVTIQHATILFLIYYSCWNGNSVYIY